MDLNFWLRLSEKQPQKPYSGSPPVLTRIWVRAMISLLKRYCWFASLVEEKFNCISSSLGPLRAQNEDIGNASRTLLTGVTIHLWCRLGLPKFLVNLSLCFPFCNKTLTSVILNSSTSLIPSALSAPFLRIS